MSPKRGKLEFEYKCHCFNNLPLCAWRMAGARGGGRFQTRI